MKKKNKKRIDIAATRENIIRNFWQIVNKKYLNVWSHRKRNKVCARIIISVMRNKWNLIIVEKYTMILCSVCTLHFV